MPWVQEALAEAEKAAIDAVSGAAPSAAQAKAAAEKAAVVAGMRYIRPSSPRARKPKRRRKARELCKP
jgi:hypothetical protein